jgi:hypothetical protein
MEKNFLDLAHKLSGVLPPSGGGSVMPSAAPSKKEAKSILGGLFGKR